MKAVIISGLSGSGKSAAVKALEDCGYYCIDNLPVPLIQSFLDLTAQSVQQIQKLALVIDARNRNYITQLPDTLKQLAKEGHSFELTFLDASDQVLARRFSETRRKHPLSPDGSPLEGIQKERKLLAPVQKLADFVLDTSDLKASELRSRVVEKFGSPSEKQTMAVQVVSFGYKHGIPLNADLVLDVRFLPNPFFREELKRQAGTNKGVIEFVMSQSDTLGLLKQYEQLLTFLVPRFDAEGKSYLTIAIGCTGGRHRSVVVAMKIAEFVEKLGYSVSLQHRDMDRE